MKKPLQVFNFTVENQANDTLDIHIDGDIVDASTQEVIQAWFGDNTSTSYKSFRDKVSGTDAKTINVYVNSPGGLVTDAMAIHDLLKGMSDAGKIVNTIGVGLVASSATLILLASPNPKMSANSFFMIHTVSGGCYGTVDQIESYGAAMRKFNDMIVDLYAKKTGMSVETVNSLMSAETWLTAEEALNKGFIAEKISGIPFSNVIKPEDWPFNNKAILNSYNRAGIIEPNNSDNMKQFFTDLSQTISTAIANALGKSNPTQPVDVEAISNLITAPFEKVGEDIENKIALAVTDALKNDQTIKDLQKKNSDLEQEIVNLKGNKQTVKDEKETPAIGSFSSGK